MDPLKLPPHPQPSLIALIVVSWPKSKMLVRRTKIEDVGTKKGREINLGGYFDKRDAEASPMLG